MRRLKKIWEKRHEKSHASFWLISWNSCVSRVRKLGSSADGSRHHQIIVLVHGKYLMRQRKKHIFSNINQILTFLLVFSCLGV